MLGPKLALLRELRGRGRAGAWGVFVGYAGRARRWRDLLNRPTLIVDGDDVGLIAEVDGKSIAVAMEALGSGESWFIGKVSGGNKLVD